MPPFDAGLVVRVVAVILAFLGLLGLAGSLSSFESGGSTGAATSSTSTANGTTPSNPSSGDTGSAISGTAPTPTGPMGQNGYRFPAGTNDNVGPARTITADGMVAPEVKQWFDAYLGGAQPWEMPITKTSLPSGDRWCYGDEFVMSPLANMTEKVKWKTEYIFSYDGFVAKTVEEMDAHAEKLIYEGHPENWAPRDYTKICLVERR